MQENSLLNSQINEVMSQSAKAFQGYRQIPAKQRASFLLAIAKNIEGLGDVLLNITAAETHLPLARLQGERGRTIGQLNMYADMLLKGNWQNCIINTAIPEKNPPRPDIRSMYVPLGPVVVFGSSNFPFAYSTAGGDTASALATGCTVVVKAHPAHPETSRLVAKAIGDAIAETGMPPHVFQHVEDSSFESGKLLVQHPSTAAVGFTGSFSGGKALWDYAAARPNPIPVFAEMGSINPVLIFPDALATQFESLATQYAASISLGVGQFCTNPGLLIVHSGPTLLAFLESLSAHLEKVSPAAMLHQGILASYAKKVTAALQQPGVTAIIQHPPTDSEAKAIPILATVSAAEFLLNPHLKEEVFGPYSLVVVADDANQMLAVLRSVTGQLTTSLMGTDIDFKEYGSFIQDAMQVAGRVICNGVPTGVEVCDAMVHGGPFPATTDSRFTAVGVEAAKRWQRPVAFQNFPDALLPDELKSDNPLGVSRKEL
ncbi:MAG: aldehyde dehydrogenase (NADP(+)) [Sediminibacterium sp.]|nr:aldehyde dehydrogenase (NADP(+)) [Sediminibacterium sp.]